MIVKKLESIFFYLLIFTIPLQARLVLHSWTKPFNQWTSAYLYGTDILLGTLLLLWLIDYRNRISILRSDFDSYFDSCWRKPGFWLVIFFSVSALSFFNSRIVGLSFYQLLKLAEFIGFYFYLKAGFGRIFDLKRVLLVIIVSGVFQSVVAIIQYVKQGSLGLRLMGESPLSVNATGVAVFIADGVKYLRAYGTTPHPNILAAWLFVGIFAFYFYYLGGSFSQNGRFSKTLKDSILLGVYAVLLVALFLTFSRVIVGLWMAGITTWLLLVIFKKDMHKYIVPLKRLLIRLCITTLVVIGTFCLFFWPQIESRIHISSQEEAVTQRIFYNKIASSIAADEPLFGVGIGQFVINMMARFKYLSVVAYQPVHNIYLLIASETGLVGLAAFLMFLFFVFWDFIRRASFADIHSFSFLILVFSFLIIGFFDHFLWTSQQGNFVFWVLVGFLGVKHSDAEAKLNL